MTNVNAGDDMRRRLESDLEQQSNFCNEIFARAEAAKRDISEDEIPLVRDAQARIKGIRAQLDIVESAREEIFQTQTRAAAIGAVAEARNGIAPISAVEYRSAGAYIVDMYNAKQDNREAQQRLALYHRAAAHQKMEDIPGAIPDPIVGPVINFIDSARPLVAVLGPQDMPYATWHRPRVTQHTAVDEQSGEKAELTSQKMVISRITGEAKTYGGYVNVSRQSIDFSNPQILDIIIRDLAAQYAIETEAATGALVADETGTAVTYGTTQDSVAGALWKAAAAVYKAVKGQGRLVLVCGADVLAAFGPLFAPYGPMNQQGTGFLANSFAQGNMGVISGVSVVMSTGIADKEAFLLSTAAVEVFERRVGQLQVVEPSVFGLQVAFGGHFCPMTIEPGGIIPLEGP